MLDRISNGRTDLVFEYLAAGHPPTAELLEQCAYYGDVSALRFLLSNGALLESFGPDMGLIGASFHGHWQLVQFLIEQGANVNQAMEDTGETPLHSALCKFESNAHTLVIEVLLANGANSNCATKPGIETGGFMRDSRTKGETPLHRAAAFGTEKAIDLLIASGARIDAPDANGDSPLGWASWHLRSASVLRRLCFGNFRIRPDYAGMAANLLGRPTGTL